MINKAKATKANGQSAKAKAPKLAAVPAVEPEPRDPRRAALLAEVEALWGDEGVKAVGEWQDRHPGPWVALLELAANIDKAGAVMGYDAATLAHTVTTIPTPHGPENPADDPGLYVALRLLHALRGFVSQMEGADEGAMFTDLGHRHCCVVERDE